MQYESDERAVARAIEALSDGEIIDHGTARTIASWFNDGGDTTIYSFVSTGAIHESDPEALMCALKRGVDARTLTNAADALCALERHVYDRAEYDDCGPVVGWSDMWVTKHVDRPHHDGALPECWCADDDDAYEVGDAGTGHGAYEYRSGN